MLAGLESVDKEMLEMAEVFNMCGMAKIYVHIPSCIYAFLLSSCKISLGMSWKSGIMAEV